jgi:hypothetical protein
MSSPTTDRVFLNKEKFLTAGAPRWGKADATSAREMSYENRHNTQMPITLLSHDHRLVIRAVPPP